MQFLIRAYDGEGKLDKRMEVHPRHLEGMKKLSEHIISAGGLLDDEGKYGMMRRLSRFIRTVITLPSLVSSKLNMLRTLSL